MEIKSLFEEALLAQAAYADLSAGLKGNELINALKALEPKGLTQAQAEYFASKYVVVEQENNSVTGFSATLFKNIETQEYHLANRGSATPFSGGDDWAGANRQNLQHGMAYDQVADLVNFYLRLTSPKGIDTAQFEFVYLSLEDGEQAPEGSVFIGHEEVDGIIHDNYMVFKEKNSKALGFGEISDTQQLNVTGHSLGGHLASAFTLLFPSISTTTTFDSAGIIGGQFDEFATAIADALRISDAANIYPTTAYSLPYSNVMDFKAPLDPVSALGSHLSGKLVDVFIETEDTLLDPIELESHDMDRLVDSLAVMNLLYTLDNSITLEKANELLPKASSDEYTELEGMMNHLARLFGKDTVAITESDHDQVYRVIKQITDTTEENSYTITAISDDIVNQALAGDKAALYALVHLQPFDLIKWNRTLL